MLSLRCVCIHAVVPEIRQSAKYQLRGKHLLDADGATVAVGAAASVGWELRGDGSSCLEIEAMEIEPRVCIAFSDCTRRGPFDKVTITSGVVLAGGETLARFNGDIIGWCDVPQNRCCDPILFEMANEPAEQLIATS